MDIKTNAPGWEEYQPFPDKHPEVKCEIRRMTFKEGKGFSRDCRVGALLMNGILRTKDGREREGLIWDYWGECAESYFTRYVRNLEGITLDGKEIKTTADVLSDTMSNNDFLGTFYLMTITEIVDRNIVTEDEGKNCEGLPTDTGGVAPDPSLEQNG